jgi:hypothetical protein
MSGRVVWKAVNDLVNEVAERLERGEVVVISVIERSSEALYNYKTKALVVAWKRIIARHEESLIRPVSVIEISTGAFQELPIYAEKDIVRELESRGFEAVLIEL